MHYSHRKRGHCSGRKRERHGSTAWYKTQEERNIRRVEAAWQAKQHVATTKAV